MTINGTTKLYGLLGNPVAHTLSPLLHNTLAEKMGHNMIYAAFPCEKKVAAAISGAYALGLAGMNVTVPYKTKVIPYLKEITPFALRIGAVNTLVRDTDGFIGYNTDTSGLYRAMKSEGMEIKDSEILILGAGGAARAAAFLCAEQGARKVFILNRTFSKARRLAAEVNIMMRTDCLNGFNLSNDFSKLPSSNLIAIQCTNLGMHPHENEILINNPDFYQRIKAGFDMVYNPAETIFMQKIREAGGKAANGLKMLLYQGIAAYELWHDVTVPEEYAEFIYEKIKHEAPH
ncbi:MAG: shikimate dehydrogenase [Lachnospiraceae bacterium]|nr:shikimate dehydrogenase [Lachnospiraceae bacterium]